MFETFNLTVFNLLNAPAAANPAVISIAVFVAEKLLFVEALVMVALWIWGTRQRRHALVVAAMTVVLALLVNALIGSMWHHPRPFVVGVGQQYLDHAADSSFPSDHGTLVFSVAFGLLFSQGGRGLGVLALVVACMVAWSRIYLGIHWPLDMVGAIGVSLLVALDMCFLQTRLAMRVSGFLDRCFNRLIAWFR